MTPGSPNGKGAAFITKFASSDFLTRFIIVEKKMKENKEGFGLELRQSTQSNLEAALKGQFKL